MNKLNKYLNTKTRNVKKALFSSKMVLLSGGEATGKTTIINILRDSSSNTRLERISKKRIREFGLPFTRLCINTIVIDAIEQDCILLDDSKIDSSKLPALIDYLRFKRIKVLLTTRFKSEEFKKIIGNKQVKTIVLEHIEDDSKEDKVNALMDMISKIEHELKSLKSELANV
ncbi:hypothetical protein EZL79_22610 [Salmonella enterica subsp. enterica]|nr:hypothetical protein [Salmonella enterica subsp. enterica]